MQESEIPKNYKKLAKIHEHMQLLDWHLLLKKVPTYSFLMRKTSCFPNEILKNRSLCTRAPPPPEPCLWEWIYKTIQFRTMMSVRKSLFFPFFSHFSIFVFFIQSEKVNVGALQFCNCFHIHSSIPKSLFQFILMSVTDFKFSGITTKTTRGSKSDSPLQIPWKL